VQDLVMVLMIAMVAGMVASIIVGLDAPPID
jgi:hypothetical protein